MAKRHIDDIFTKALLDHEVVPPSRVWDKIEQDLPEPVPFLQTSFFKYGMTGLVVVLFAGLTLYWAKNNHNQLGNSNAADLPMSYNTAVNPYKNYNNYLSNTKQQIGQPSHDFWPTLDHSYQTINHLNSNFVVAEMVRTQVVQERNNRQQNRSVIATPKPSPTVLSIPIQKDIEKKQEVDESSETPSKPVIQDKTDGLIKKISLVTDRLHSDLSPSFTASSIKEENNKNKLIAPFVAPQTIYSSPLAMANERVGASLTKDISSSEQNHLPQTYNKSNRNVALASASKVVQRTTSKPISEITKKTKIVKEKVITTSTAYVPNIKAPDLFPNTSKNQISKVGRNKLTKASLFPTTSTAGLHFGVFGNVHNSWLLSNRAIEANQNGTLAHNLDFGSAYGFALGYDFSRHWGLQFEWIINSKQGQKFYNYRPMEKMRHHHTQIDLQYTHFPILLKYRFNKFSALTKQPMTLNYLFGVQYGWLKSIGAPIDNPVIHEDLYKKYTWGLVMGVDYDLYLTPNYFFSIGARSSLSTTYNSLNDFTLPFGDRTKNLLFGVRASLSYRFNK